MDKDPLVIIATIACIVVVAILATGIAGYAKGGEFNKKYGNKLMRWRIGAQFVAILLILAVLAVRGSGGSN